MSGTKSVYLIAAVLIAVTASSGAANAASRIMQMNPNLVPKNLAGPTPTVSPSRVVRCSNQIWYGKAEMYVGMPGVPVEVPASVKNKLLPEALNNWRVVVAQSMGGNWADPSIARNPQTRVEYDHNKGIWWANWSAVPCTK